MHVKQKLQVNHLKQPFDWYNHQFKSFVQMEAFLTKSLKFRTIFQALS